MGKTRSQRSSRSIFIIYVHILWTVSRGAWYSKIVYQQHSYDDSCICYEVFKFKEEEVRLL